MDALIVFFFVYQKKKDEDQVNPVFFFIVLAFKTKKEIQKSQLAQRLDEKMKKAMLLFQTPITCRFLFNQNIMSQVRFEKD